MLRLHIYGRHTTRAGTITNFPQGDDTWELLGPAPELRAYAEHGIETQATRPHGPDRTYLERVYTNILRELDTADLAYYEVDPDGGNIMDQDFCLAHETARLDTEIVRNRTPMIEPEPVFVFAEVAPNRTAYAWAVDDGVVRVLGNTPAEALQNYREATPRNH